MEPALQSETPNVPVEDSNTGLMATERQPPHDDVRQVPSADGGHQHHSNTSTQLAATAPPVSQLETTSMPDESVIPYPTLSDSLPETPQNALAASSQSAIVHGGASPSYSVAPMDSGSDDDHTHSSHECGSPFVVLSTPRDPPPSPLHVPLPESDDEDSESTRYEGVSGMTDGRSQNSDASTGGRTTPSSDADVPNEAQPSTADDNLDLWVLGDTVLERHDRRVYERWKAGLGVTFVLANILSVIILCIALEIYRRTKAAHPGLLSKIRARHRARTGKDTRFSPIVSLFFEADAPFLNSNIAFLMGLCTTLICTLLSDMALRWVARYEERQPPADATPRERMIARMEWNERMERYAVPWVLEIGIPGLLYVALFFFLIGAISRNFPFLNTPTCWSLAVVWLVFAIGALWSFEPALDARLRPKPFSYSTRR